MNDREEYDQAVATVVAAEWDFWHPIVANLTDEDLRRRAPIVGVGETTDFLKLRIYRDAKSQAECKQMVLAEIAQGRAERGSLPT